MKRIISAILFFLASMAAANDNIALFNQNSSTVFMKNTLTGGSADEFFAVTGTAGAANQLLPVGGAFERDDLHSVAIFDRSTGKFHIRHTHVDGPADLVITFLPSGAGSPLFPIAGDWDGDGDDTIGIWDRSTGVFFLRNSNSAGAPDFMLSIDLVAGTDWVPLAGDWDGDGKDSVGGFNVTSKVFMLRNQVTTGASDVVATFENLDPSGVYLPIVGDWDSDGAVSFGVYRQDTSRFFMRNSLTTGDADFEFSFGVAGYWPLAGNWDGKAFRLPGIPPGPDGQLLNSFPQLVRRADQSFPEFELYFPAQDKNADSSAQTILYNVMLPNGGWQYPTSPVVIDHRDTASTALGSVFLSETNVFRDPTGANFKRLMYYVYQRSNSPYAGWICLAYSNDGLAWTSPVMATKLSGDVPQPCFDVEGDEDEEITVEAVSGFRLGDDIWLAGMYGKISVLAMEILAETVRTRTYLYRTNVDAPWLLEEVGEFSSEGIERPNRGERFLHAFGINLDFAYDPAGGAVYFSRTYPYAYDSSGGIPCDNPSSPPRCPTGLTQNPMRAQVYRMLVSRASIKDVLMGPWELLRDYGASAGYRDDDSGACVHAPLEFSYQERLGLDINSITFYKDQNGLADRSASSESVVVFGAGPKHLTYGNCDRSARAFYALPEKFPGVIFGDGFESGDLSAWDF